ncbi:histidine kinase dimerization/phosphoacceptor domain -containing protein [Spirosoma sp. KNUC1025]|uniref:histidine kinase dimerization/phosphoacceptor domain -containing protein n=1 Tax=Spirosoma sp. KNUC1025 TaxID=2894082 RepID=UPI0038706205|nr:tetratricopeptide repeat protein [Spirosoma sp. KNUC1025]
MARSYVLKPGSYATDLDTALILVRQAYHLCRPLAYIKGKGNAYLIGGMAYRDKGDQKRARSYDRQAIQLFTKYKYPAELAAAYMECGNTFGNTDDELKQKIRYYELALPLFQQVGNREREATTRKELGDFNQILGKYLQSLTQLKQSLKIYQSIGFTDLQGVYDLLGIVNICLADYKEALKYGHLALKTAEIRQDTTLQLCTIYNRLGITYSYLKDNETAIGYFQKALSIARRYRDTMSIWIVSMSLINSYNRLNKFDQSLQLLKFNIKRFPPPDLLARIYVLSQYVSSYQGLKNYRLAQQYCNQLIALLPQVKDNDYEALSIIYQPAINFYLASRQFNKARPLVVAYNAHCELYDRGRRLAQTYLAWYKVDSAQANYRSAMDHFRQYKVIEDSLLNEAKAKEIAKIQVDYQTDKKEQQLKLKESNIRLLTKENQVHQANLSQQATQRNSLICGTVLLLLTLGITYNRYRLKQRTNQQLQAKQQLIDQNNQSLQQLLEEREWMLKEIHHRVKNNLQVISSMLNTQFNFLQDPSALAAIRESQNRVQVMALIHQKLYQSANLTQIGMRDYVQDIVDYLIESFDRSGSVHAQVNVADVFFSVSLATPLGLIINEAVTNSLKYAFPDHHTGQLIVSLSNTHDQVFQLVIRDDGIGLPADFDVTASQTLGMTMIRGLSKQIKGQLEISQSDGVMISLQFSNKPKPKPQSVLQTTQRAG